MGLYEQIRQTYRRIMAPVWVRKVYLVVGSTICLGIFYRPFIKSVLYPRSRMSEEELKCYDLEHIYVVKKKKALAEQQAAKTGTGTGVLENKQ